MVSSYIFSDLCLDSYTKTETNTDLHYSLLGHHQACRSNGVWENVKFIEYCYVGANGAEFSARDVQSKEFVNFAEDFEVDFPSIVFYCKPDDGSPLYNRIKVLSNYLGGVQTQCAVIPNFNKQRNKKDQ